MCASLFGLAWLLHACSVAASQNFLQRGQAGDATALRVINRCPFGVKVMDGGGNSWQTVEIGQDGGEASIATDQCTESCRTYFAPSSWQGTPGQFSMGAVEPLGMFEYTKMQDGTLSTDISYIGGIGIPMTQKCDGSPLYGCTDGGYGGYASFQTRLKEFCPGEVKQFPGSSISMCKPGQYGGVASMRYGQKWDIAATFSKASVAMSSSNPQDVAFCQPWSEADPCVQIARGANGCLGESTCDGESLFYQGYDMRGLDSQDPWLFNGYAAFVHTICGVYAGFAFPSDDRGGGTRDGVPMKYASNIGSGCRNPVIELCPASSPSYTPSGGYTYPPASPGEGPAAPSRAPAPALAPAPTWQGVYTVKNINAGTYLNVEGGLTTIGANVQVWDNPSSIHSQWKIRPVSDGVYTFENLNSGKFLNVAGGGDALGTNVHVWDNPGSPDSQWEIREVAESVYTLKAICCGRYLNVVGGKGPNVWIWDNPQSDDSRWEIRRVQ
jgi:hypothetical protein